MQTTWSQIETQAVINKLSETRNVDCIRCYQNIRQPHFLVVNLTDTGGYEIGKLAEMGLCVCIFGDGMRVELWISKLS